MTQPVEPSDPTKARITAVAFAGSSGLNVDLSVDGDWARLAVGDDGPGIAIEERERVFERFYRADAARTGHGAGLGLSIARWITEQHGGRIIADRSRSGGAGLYVDLPLLRRS